MSTLETAPRPTAYEIVGGEAMVRRLADRFYDIMDSAPKPRASVPCMAPTSPPCASACSSS